MFKKFLSLAVIFCFVLTSLGPLPQAHADSVLGLPEPGTMVNVSSAYVPVIARGLRIHPENPILFDFIIDSGNSGLGASDTQFKSESEKIIKYFLATLTTPDDDQWVNLSPYEKNRIIPEQLGQTAMGRDMLAEDYILKQLTASLIYPEKNLGKEFWNKVYAKSQQLYGTSEVPINTFNKVWVMPDKADIYVHDNTAFIVQSHLKVMLEEDYLSLEKHNGIQNAPQSTHSIGSQIVREIILPEIEKEVNTGKNFANLRQIFHSMILATWYKQNLKEALLNQIYSDKNKIVGVDVSDKTIKEQIYKQYLKAYKKGVFNFIKDDIFKDRTITRKYFSGGFLFGKTLRNKVQLLTLAAALLGLPQSPIAHAYDVQFLTPKASSVVASAPAVIAPAAALAPQGTSDAATLTRSIKDKLGLLTISTEFFQNSGTGVPHKTILDKIIKEGTSDYNRTNDNFNTFVSSDDKLKKSVEHLKSQGVSFRYAKNLGVPAVRVNNIIYFDSLLFNNKLSSANEVGLAVLLRAYLVQQIFQESATDVDISTRFKEEAVSVMAELEAYLQASPTGWEKVKQYLLGKGYRFHNGILSGLDDLVGSFYQDTSLYDSTIGFTAKGIRRVVAFVAQHYFDYKAMASPSEAFIQEIATLRDTKILRKNLEDSRDYYQKALHGDVPTFDYVYVLGATAEQSQGFQKEIDEGIKLGIFPPHTKIKAVPPPHDKNVGQTGSVLNALKEIAEDIAKDKELKGESYQSLEQLLQGKRILTILSGGSSQRIPPGAATGKINLLLPAAINSTGGRQITTKILNELMVMLSGMAANIPGGLVFLPGDALMTFNYDKVDLNKPGALEIVQRGRVETAVTHGVRVTGPDGIMSVSVEKNTEAQLRALGAVDQHGLVNFSTGLTKMDNKTLGRLLTLAGCEVGEKGLSYDLSKDLIAPARNSSSPKDVPFDIWGGLLEVFGTQMTREEYVALGKTDQMKEIRQRVWDTFRPAGDETRYHVQAVSPLDFGDFGTTEELYRHLMTSDVTHEVYGFPRWFSSFIHSGVRFDPTGDPPGIFVSVVESHALQSSIGNNTMVMLSRLDGPFKIGNGSIVFNIDVGHSEVSIVDNNGQSLGQVILEGDRVLQRIGVPADVTFVVSDHKVENIQRKGQPIKCSTTYKYLSEFNVKDNILVYQVPVTVTNNVKGIPSKEEGTVTIFTGVYDNPKEGKFLGMDLNDWIQRKGLEPEKVWPGVPEKSRALWNARLFAYDDPTLKSMNWIQDLNLLPPQEWWDRYNSGRLVSMQDASPDPSRAPNSRVTVNFARLFESRNALLSSQRKHHTQSTTFDKTMKEEWPKAMERGLVDYDPSDTSAVEVTNVGPYVVRADSRRFNPDRPSLSPTFDGLLQPITETTGFNFTKVASAANLMLKNVGNRIWRVLANKAPIFANHLLFIPDVLRPQFLTVKGLRGALALIRNNNLDVYFNAVGAAASVNQEHLQGVFRDTLPNGDWPVKKFETVPIFKTGDVTISSVPAWAGSPLVLEGQSESSIEKTAIHLLAVLNQENIPYNILFTKRNEPGSIRDGNIQMYIYAKNPERMMTSLGVNPATPEMSGVMTLADPKYKGHPPTADQISQALKEASLPEDRMSIVLWKFRESLNQGLPAYSEDTFKEALRAGGDAVRKFLVVALISVNRNDMIADLERIFKSADEDSALRKGVFAALGYFGGGVPINILSNRIKKGGPADEILIAVQSLRKIKSPLGIPALLAALNHPNFTVYLEAAKALGDIGDVGAVSGLTNVIGSEKPGTMALKYNSAVALGRINYKGQPADQKMAEQAIRALLERNYPYDYVRKALVEALGNIGLPESLPVLQGVLTNGQESYHVRLAAAKAMGKIQGDNAMRSEALRNAFTLEKNPLVKEAILSSLGNLAREPEQTVPFLITAMGNNSLDIGVRAQAVIALSRFINKQGADQEQIKSALEGNLKEVSAGEPFSIAKHSALLRDVRNVVRLLDPQLLDAEIAKAASVSPSVKLEASPEINTTREELFKELEFNGLNALSELWQGSGYWTKPEIDSPRLGWMRSPMEMQDLVGAMNSEVESMRAEGITDVVVLGMGGNTQGLYTYQQAFGQKPGYPRVHIVDTTSPRVVAKLKEGLDLNKTVFVYSSKGGSAAEPQKVFNYFYPEYKGTPEEIGHHFIALTDPDLPLNKQAQDQKFRNTFNTKFDVGGRFGSLSTEMMFVAAVMGIDIKKLLQSTVENGMFLHRDFMNIRQSPGAQLAVAMEALRRKGYDKLNLLGAGKLSQFAPALEQDIAESLGKDGLGIFPVTDEPIADDLSVYKDTAFVYIHLTGEQDAQLGPKLDALRAKGLPVVEITIPNEDALGSLFYSVKFAIALTGRLMNINPFDEPGVVQSKLRIGQVLKAGIPEPNPDNVVKDVGLELDYNAVINSGEITKRELEEQLAKISGTADNIVSVYAALFLLARQKGRNFAGLLPYMESSQDERDVWNNWRMAARQSGRMTTFLGEGPRFQHSALQLFQAGPNQGFYTFITEKKPENDFVTSDKVSFGYFIRAQASGTLRALSDDHRIALNISVDTMAPATRKNLDRIFREAFEIIQRAQGTKDLAALSQRPQVNRIAVPGGIDLNARNLKMGVGGDKINIKFDPAMIEQFKRGDFSGVRPVIVNITPISSVLPMLGLKEGEYLAAAPVSLPQT